MSAAASVCAAPGTRHAKTADTFTFNNYVSKHRFCPRCGIFPYGAGIDAKAKRMAAINIRCLEGIDLASIPVQNFDGRSM